MRQAPSQAWCLKIPRASAQARGPYSPLFLAFLQDIFVSFSPPCDNTNSWSLPRPRDYPHSWSRCKKTSNLHIAAEPRRKPGIDDPIFRFTGRSGLAQSVGLMHDEMGAHAQDVTGSVFSSNAVIPGMVGLYEDLGRFQAFWAALQGLATVLITQHKVIGESSDSYFQPIDCSIIYINSPVHPCLLLTKSAAFALTLSTPRSSPCFSSNVSHFLNKT